MSHSSLDRRSAVPVPTARISGLRVGFAVLIGLLVSMVPLGVRATPAPSPTAAAGQLTTLFTTMDGDRTVTNADSVPVGPSSLGHFRAAMAFTPTVSGKAEVLSMRGRCVIPYPRGTTCQGFGKVTIQGDAGGRPNGRVLGAMGFYLTDSLSNGSPVKKECGTISPAPQLTAGTKYWAVMTSDDQIGWDQWTDDTAEVLQTLDDNPWEESFNPKTLALRIDSGSNTCVAVAVPNPDPGTSIGNMTARGGEKSFNTITISNSGVAPLTLSGATFTGTGANAFTLMDMEPHVLAKPFPFPRQVGVGGVTILYLTCTGPAAEGLYKASLTIETSDQARPKVTYPVECLVDNSPPTVGFTVTPPDGSNGWWKTSPIPLTVFGTDLSLVTRVSCSDDNPAASWNPPSVGTSIMTTSISGEGTHNASCSATDIAGNTSAGKTTSFKIDSRPPVAVPTVTPAPTADGWNNAPTTVTFMCQDPQPSSGINQPVSGGGDVTVETAGTDFSASGCTDKAGNVSTPVTVTVKVDKTAPAIEGATVTPAPNGSGWNNTDLTVSFNCVDKGTVQSGIKSSPAAVTVKDNTPGWTVTAAAADCVDKAANKAAAGATKTVKIDKTAPSTDLDSGPESVTGAASATFKYRGSDPLSGVAKFECRIDGGAYSTCPASGKTYSGLAEGSHTFDVRAFDVAGNPDSTPASMSWTIDTSAPETSVTSSPEAVTSATSATITYGGDGGGGAVAGYECRLDDAAFQACPAAGMSYTSLAAGGHHFEVRSVDAVGNKDSSPAVATWTIDLVGPESSIADGPPAESRVTAATFVFDAVDTGGSSVARYECRLDDAAFAPCASPLALTGLSRTAHSFQVRAVDGVGNVESTPADYSWAVLSFFAQDDSATALEDTTTPIDVAGNDVAVAGMPTVTVPGSSSAMGGNVTADDQGVLHYTPPAEFHGTDTFAYTLSNGSETSEATVTVTVAAVNDAPTFTPGGAITVNEDAAAYHAAWASGISAGPDEAGQKMHFVIDGNTNPRLFSAAPALSATGELTFTPARNANGTATVTARLVDDGGRANGGVDASEPVALTIRVNPMNDAPTITLVSAVTCANTSATLQVQLSDVDSKLSTLRVSPAVSDRRVRASSSGTGTPRRVTVTGLNHPTRATLTVKVSDGSLSGSTAVGLLVGTDRGETLSGSGGSNLVFGRGGSDALNGAAGNDLICGGVGNDRINGGAGSDTCDGGTGTDRATACERKASIP